MKECFVLTRKTYAFGSHTHKAPICNKSRQELLANEVKDVNAFLPGGSCFGKYAGKVQSNECTKHLKDGVAFVESRKEKLSIGEGSGAFLGGLDAENEFEVVDCKDCEQMNLAFNKNKQLIEPLKDCNYFASGERLKQCFSKIGLAGEAYYQGKVDFWNNPTKYKEMGWDGKGQEFENKQRRAAEDLEKFKAGDKDAVLGVIRKLKDVFERDMLTTTHPFFNDDEKALFGTYIRGMK